MENQSEDRCRHGECICCLEKGHHREILEEYYFNGVREVYYDMFNETFNLVLSRSTLLPSLLCARCVTRLRDARALRAQAQDSERLLAARAQMLFKYEQECVEIKSEPEESDDVEYLEENLLHNNVEDTENNEKNGHSKDCFEAVVTLDDHDEIDEYSETERSAPTEQSPKKVGGSETDTPKSKVPLQEPQNTYRQYTANEEVCLSLSTFVAEMRTLLSYFNVTPFRNRAAVTSCYYCSDRREFDSPQEMKTHTKLHHPDQIDKIEMALRSLRPSWTNELVKLDIHDLRCIVCDQKMTWPQVFTHLEEHHATTITSKNKLLPFDLTTDNKCVLCTESFNSITQLDWHLNKHYPNYICGHCGGSFASLTRFRAHERTYRTGRYPCKICHKVFALKKYMTKHIALKHMKVKKIKCYYCGEAFVTEYNRQVHVAKEHSEHVQIYTCEVCGETFDWLRTFTRHMTRRHSTQFYCKICSKSFMSSKAFEYHNTIHNGDSYECPVCQRCYSSFNTLKSHVKFSHKNLPKYVKEIFAIK